jgi:hypothetical protein
MERSVPRTAEQKPGGLEVISFRPSECRPSAPPYEITAKKDRFSGPKNSAYTAAARSLLRWRNTVKNSDLVTTTHVLWPNQRRKAVLSLRNWQPNPAHCLRCERNGGCPPGGGVGYVQPDGALDRKRSRNFLPNESPLPLLPKKCAARATRIPNKRTSEPYRRLHSLS